MPVKPTHMGSCLWMPSVFSRWSFMSLQIASTLLKSSYRTRKVNCIWRGLLKLTMTLVLAMRDSLEMICSDRTCRCVRMTEGYVNVTYIVAAKCMAATDVTHVNRQEQITQAHAAINLQV